MICRNCGTKLANGVSFCRECGTKVEFQKRFCRECGTELKNGVKFCSSCGTSINIQKGQNEPISVEQKYVRTTNSSGISQTDSAKKQDSTIVSHTRKNSALYIFISAFVIALVIFIVLSINHKSKDQNYTDILPHIDTEQTGPNTIAKDYQYAYMSDEWHVYIAKAISDSIIKIEKWDKTLNSSKSVGFDSDIGTYKINDAESGFAWVDKEHTTFLFTLKDDNNSKIKQGKQVAFTVNISDSDVNKGSDYSEDIYCYTYTNDDWHMYRAIPLTDSLMKIECWFRGSSMGKFLFGYDWCVININDNDVDFAWSDDEHDSFTITVKDNENDYYWKEEKLVSFTLENKDSKYPDVLSYINVSAKPENVERQQKNAFDEHNSIQIGNYSFVIPTYWVADTKEKDNFRAYAEKSDKVAMIQIKASYDYMDKVTYELLKSENDKGLMANAFKSWFDSHGDISSVAFNNGNINGFIYSMDFVKSGYDGECICLCFPSESDNKWFYVYMTQTDNTEYSYVDDFEKVLDSISIVQSPNMTDSPKEAGSDTSGEEALQSTTPKETEVILPDASSKLGKDFDSKSSLTVVYINVDNIKNKPKLTTWNNTTVTDGVAEYFKTLKDQGFTVEVTYSDVTTPYKGFTNYESYFKVSDAGISWEVYLNIQDEDYVEYEFDIYLP